jgi:hypothetical protein
MARIMGADLYINSIHERHYEEYKGLFDAAVARRDHHPWGSPEAEAAQADVSRYYDLMFDEEGYFRDSYNNSSLLWVLGLSWWQDVGNMLDEEGHLPLEAARRLRADVAQRAEIMERKIAQHEEPFGDEQAPGETREDVIAYFRDKLRRFIAFLDKSLELEEPIYCSI